MEKNELRKSSIILIVLAVLSVVAFLVFPWFSFVGDVFSSNPKSSSGWEIISNLLDKNSGNMPIIVYLIWLAPIVGPIWLIFASMIDKELHKILASLYMLAPIAQAIFQGTNSWLDYGAWIYTALVIVCILVSAKSDKIDGIETSIKEWKPVPSIKDKETHEVVDELGELKRLLITNAITQKEYNIIKEKLIEKL